MSTPPISQPSGAFPHEPLHAPIEWVQPERQVAFHQWLNAQASAHGVLPTTVRAASADASFRRYFRVDTAQGSCIVMDAPPDKENCEPFVRIARLMQDAGLYVPRILAWDEPQGFMLLDDLGSRQFSRGGRIVGVHNSTARCSGVSGILRPRASCAGFAQGGSLRFAGSACG